MRPREDNVYDELYEVEEGNPRDRRAAAAAAGGETTTSARNSDIPSYYVNAPGH